MSFSLAVLASEFEFTITLGEDLQVTGSEPISRGNIGDGRMQPHGVVVVNEAFDKASGIVLGKRTTRSDAISFEALVPSLDFLDFTVTLRVIGRGLDMGQAGQTDKLLKVFGDKLRTVVVMIRGESSRIFFPGSLQDDLDVELRHRGANSQCSSKREQPSRTEQR